MQTRRFGASFSALFGKKDDAKEAGRVTPFQAVCTALGGTVGTGNIAGVAGAISLGGPGAVFWMLFAAFFGMAVKYAEIFYSVKFRERDANGNWRGGPMIAIQNGLPRKWHWLAWLFAVCGMIAAFGVGNLAQVHTLSESISLAASSFGAGDTLLQWLPPAVGVGLALLSARVLLGGAGKLGRTMEGLVPVMSILYIVLCLICLVKRHEQLLPALAGIWKSAFTPHAALGGAAGLGISAAFRKGVERGVFTHEAGMGSSAIAHAAADNSPEKQALLGIFEVFADTFLICSLTALVILTAPISIPYGQDTGMTLSAAAFSANLGEGFTAAALALCIILFAAASIWAWGFYGSRCAAFLFGERAVPIFLIIFCAAMLLGTYARLELVWQISEWSNAAMAAPNLLALFFFTKKPRECCGMAERSG